MKLKTLSSSSSGNCHILTSNSGKHLIVEAGIPVPEIKRGIDFDVGNVEAVIASHCHHDHSLSCNKLRNAGLKVWEPYTYQLSKVQRTRFGEFDVSCFDLPHNGVENRGFLIRVDGITICYLCDLEYCEWDLSNKGINVLMVECNYMEELVDEQAENYKHKVLGHCSLDTCIGIIKANLKHLRTVELLHMSNSGSFDREKAMERIKAEIPPYIEVVYAAKDLEINLDEYPF